MLLLNKKVLLFFFLLFSLIVSLLLGENSSGGSKHDFLATKIYIDTFKLNFISGLQLFKETGEFHSPVFYIIIANLSKIFGHSFVSYSYIIVSSLIPIICFEILKKKFPRANIDYLYFLSLLIFLSPYFRSSAVWLTTDNLALLFFLLSINSFIKLENLKNGLFKDSLFCIFFLILASYIRPYYALFFIFYFFMFEPKLNLLEKLYIVVFSIVCSVPMIVYFFFIFEPNNTSRHSYFFEIDLIFNILTFTSLFFFYFLPFTLNFYGLSKFKEFFNLKKKFIASIILASLLIFFLYDIPKAPFGGGIFYKIAILSNPNFFLIFSCLGTLFLYIFNNNDKRNILIYLTLIFAFPFTTLFQKYYDPLIYILILTLINSKIINELILNNKINFLLLISYYSIFLIFCNIYYS